jgi:8-oxo-dGTP pyrophosphatase MutT (NUDIX family)
VSAKSKADIVTILLVQNGQFILQKRTNDDSIADPNLVGPWGGSVDSKDKSSRYAAVRELEEETGISVKAEDLSYVGSYRAQATGRGRIFPVVSVDLYCLNVDSKRVINCYEGQHSLAITSLEEIPESLRSDFLTKAILLYESTR